MKNIDWVLFKKQKQCLVDLISEGDLGLPEEVDLIDGIINLMDAIQDEFKPAGETNEQKGPQENQGKEFEAITRPVIEWLNNNCHPHHSILIDHTSAVLYEGSIGYTTEDYLKD